MDLANAIDQFDITDANLRRLEKVWDEMLGLVPQGIAFVENGPDGQRYRELARAYDALARSLPAIDSFTVRHRPMDLNAIAQTRLDAHEIGEIEALVSVDEEVNAPGRDLEEYRHRLQGARRQLVRDRLLNLSTEIEMLLARLCIRVARDNHAIADPEWSTLVGAVNELERLSGGLALPKGRWADLRRHLAFGQGVDLHDIADFDWPTVRGDIEANLYSELEPIPLEVDDLTSLVESRPTGPVTTALHWERIDAEHFERLLFNLLSDADGYTNPQLLTRTTAPDRGRDISVERLTTDSLSGLHRQRVFIQARHWLQKSVGLTDVSGAVQQAALWEPPRVDVVVIATSGRFTSDAVAWAEGHNQKGDAPQIEMWPDTLLEMLLAQRPHLVAGFNLR